MMSGAAQDQYALTALSFESPSPPPPDRASITAWLSDLQGRICKGLEEADGLGRFASTQWQRPGGGGGHSRVLQQGRILEKGGVGFSAVEGPVTERMRRGLGLEGQGFYATGVSIVLHPVSPMIPIIHMNVRYFELDTGVWWFGGGIDLTPHYVVPMQARWFHEKLRDVCNAYRPGWYDRVKPWADDYFYLPHRGETRGVGGIFFDRMGQRDEAGVPKEAIWRHVQGVGEAFLPIYTHLMALNADTSYGPTETEWQRLRRGRYVEFNLVWDAGTKFGLETDGRTESILMSLPPLAGWAYEHTPAPDSPEAHTQAWLKKGIDYLSVVEGDFVPRS